MLLHAVRKHVTQDLTALDLPCTLQDKIHNYK